MAGFRATLAALLVVAAPVAAGEALSEAEVRGLARPGAIWCSWPDDGFGCLAAEVIGPPKGGGFATDAHFALRKGAVGGALTRRIARISIDYVFEGGRLCETAPPDPATARVYADGAGMLRRWAEGAAPSAAERAEIAEILSAGGPNRVCFTFEIGDGVYLSRMWSGETELYEGAPFHVLPPGREVRLDLQ